MDHLHGSRVAFHEGRVGGAARQCLDPGRATPREQVQDDGPAQVRVEDREEGLLDAVTERPGPLPRRLEADRAGRARDDAAGVRHGPSRAARRFRGHQVAEPATLQLRGEDRLGRVDRAFGVEHRLGVGPCPGGEIAVRGYLE